MKNNSTKSPITIQNCNFSGVTFDPSTIETLALVAEGLTENAKALGHLAAVFRHSNITIDKLLNVDAEANFSLGGSLKKNNNS